MTSEKPRRRWFRYSLRTIIVALTLLCAWLAWNVSIVRERNYWCRWIQEQGGICSAMGPDPNAISWVRRLMGDDVTNIIHLPRTVPRSTFDQISAAFPEAGIVYIGEVHNGN